MSIDKKFCKKYYNLYYAFLSLPINCGRLYTTAAVCLRVF